MKRVLLIAILLLVPVGAWGADYYADATRPDNTGNGTSWATAEKTIKACVDDCGAGDTCWVSGGTYAGETAMISLDAAGQILKGDAGLGGVNQKADGAAAYGTAGRTIVDQSKLAGANFSLAADGVKVYDIDFINEDTAANQAIYCQTAGVNTIVQGCRFYNSGIPIYAHTNSTGHTWRLNKIYGSQTSTLDLRDGSSGTFSYNLVSPWQKADGTLVQNAPISVSHSTTIWNFYNNVLSGFNQYLLNATVNKGGTSLFRNNFIFPHAVGTSPTVMFTQPTSTTHHVIDFDYNWIANSGHIPGTSQVSASGLTMTDGGHNIYYADPRIVSPTRFGYIFMVFDDNSTFAYAKAAADSIFNPLDQYVGMALNFGSATAKPTLADVQAFVNAGNDVVNHGYSHTDLSVASAGTIGAVAKSLSITITRTDAADYTTWSSAVEVTGQTPMVTTYASTLANLQAYLTSKGVTLTLTTSVDSGTLITELADVAAADLSGGLTLSWSSPAHEHVQVAEGAKELQAWIRTGATGRAATYVVKLHAASNNGWSSTAADEAQAHGLLGARGNGDTYQNGSWTLGSLSPYDIIYIPYSRYQQDCTGTCSDGGATEQNYFLRNTLSMHVAAESSGWVKIIYTHTDASGMDNTELGWLSSLVSTLKYANFKTKLNDFLDMIWTGTGPDGNGWTASGAGGTTLLSHTFVDLSDYRVQCGSPLINAGVDVGLTTDFLGNPIQSPPDIGAYEFQYSCTTLGSGPAATLGSGPGVTLQ